jgi:hypothetical protein
MRTGVTIDEEGSQRHTMDRRVVGWWRGARTAVVVVAASVAWRRAWLLHVRDGIVAHRKLAAENAHVVREWNGRAGLWRGRLLATARKKTS